MSAIDASILWPAFLAGLLHGVGQLVLATRVPHRFAEVLDRHESDGHGLIAMEQGRVAICHAFGIPFEGTVDPCPVSAIYGMPEVSGAGITEEQCREQGLNYGVGLADLALTPRGAIAGRGGLLKLIFLKTDRTLIGVHCVGDIASEIVGIGQMLIRCGGTLNTIANISLNTPTYSYAYKYAAFDGLRRMATAARPAAYPVV